MWTQGLAERQGLPCGGLSTGSLWKGPARGVLGEKALSWAAEAVTFTLRGLPHTERGISSRGFASGEKIPVYADEKILDSVTFGFLAANP